MFVKWRKLVNTSWIFSALMMYLSLLLCCFTSTEARRLIRDGDGGEGDKEWRLDLGYHPKETGETVDHRQNNGSVKAVSPQHCPATCALCNCCFNCCVWAEWQRQCPLHYCWWTTWTTRSKRSPTFAAQLHLPTHDLFWANLKVKLHLPPLRSLDLLISPGTLYLSLWGSQAVLAHFVLGWIICLGCASYLKRLPGVVGEQGTHILQPV